MEVNVGRLCRILAAIGFVLILATPGLAQKGNGPSGGNGTGASNCSYILDGAYFSYSGIVVSVDFQDRQGGGMVISTSDGSVAVYGLGPYWYWDQQKVDRPVVGERVHAEGYSLSLGGQAYNLLMSLTVSGNTIQLRDQETGCPLWR